MLGKRTSSTSEPVLKIHWRPSHAFYGRAMGQIVDFDLDPLAAQQKKVACVVLIGHISEAFCGQLFEFRGSPP